MNTDWKLKDKAPEEFLKQYSQHHPLVLQLLYNRNLKNPEEIEEFLLPDYDRHLNNPFLFQDMEKAVERIFRAIENKEKICIYGDYDADAVTASAVLILALKKLGAQVFSYIPDRFTEGYGVNLEALDKIRAQGASLIVTVDCGTNSVDAAVWAKQSGVDFIVTDHHEIIGEPPEAFALINPKNPADTYPYREITGVGVAFKLAQGLFNRLKVKDLRLKDGQDEVPSGWEKWLLDLVAIGTVADCHQLLGENRVLVGHGLKVLAKTKWPGLKALCQVAGLDFSQVKPDTYTLGFVVAPRLNAAGRLEHASIALDVLLEENFTQALVKAQQLEEINQRRQMLTQQVMSEARQQAELLADRKILLLKNPGWPKGVVGLAAGKIAEEYRRPTIVLSEEAGLATGSARTIGEFSIIEALKHSADLLMRFGGHQQAAGLSLKIENFEALYEKLLEFAEGSLQEADLKRFIELEAVLSPEDLNLEVLQALFKLEPFGVGNPRPKFLLPRAQVRELRVVGKEGRHLQVKFSLGDTLISGIGFNLAFVTEWLKTTDWVDVACELIEDNWNGNRGVKLRLVDIKKH
jgi:single-stranded-DNA-specific exonuclease